MVGRAKVGNERIEGEGEGLIREGKNRINRDKYWLSEWTGRGIYIYIYKRNEVE